MQRLPLSERARGQWGEILPRPVRQPALLWNGVGS